MSDYDLDSATDEAGDALLSFDLDDDDDAWLRRIREAESAPLARIGGFELLSEISRGGQGVVYRARRVNGDGAVALKRLLGGALAGASSRVRLQRELELAAALDHVGIVRMLGIEHTDDQSLLVMEWIDGVPITEWAHDGDHQRSPGEIVALMFRVCDALRHAHQRGVIHRDLKPSNILVDARDEPHVLDFGLARLVRSEDEFTLTASGAFVGTRAYASPEQLAGDRQHVDVRSDVYSLGVIFHELLTRRLPHDPNDSRRDEPMRSIVSRTVDRDLDAIVRKAIAADPEQRYQSIDALRDDLSRHEAGEPIAARWPTRREAAWRFVRRHRVAATFAGVVAALVLGGGTIATVLALQLASAQQRERDARSEAEQVSAFLQEMLASADPAQNAGADVTARQLLDVAGARLVREFDDQPAVRAALHETIGLAYLNLGLYDESDEHLQASFDIRDELRPGPDAETASSLSSLGMLRYAQGRYAEGEHFARRALDEFIAVHGREHVDVAMQLNDLGALRRAQGDLDEAEAHLREALALRRSLLPEDHPDVAETMNNLAGVARARGDLPAAEVLCRDVLEMRRRHFGQRHMLVAQSMDNLGLIIAEQDWSPQTRSSAFGGSPRLPEALPLLRDALAMTIDLLGPNHPAVAVSSSNQGRLLLQAGEPAQAEPLLREALRIREAALPPGDPRTAVTREAYAECLRQLGRHDEANRVREPNRTEE